VGVGAGGGGECANHVAVGIFQLKLPHLPPIPLQLGWVDIGTRTKVPLKFVIYLSKITKINEKSVLTQ
jgi:hypothetical protein